MILDEMRQYKYFRTKENADSYLRESYTHIGCHFYDSNNFQEEGWYFIYTNKERRSGLNYDYIREIMPLIDRIKILKDKIIDLADDLKLCRSMEKIKLFDFQKDIL